MYDHENIMDKATQMSVKSEEDGIYSSGPKITHKSDTSISGRKRRERRVGEPPFTGGFPGNNVYMRPPAISLPVGKNKSDLVKSKRGIENKNRNTLTHSLNDTRDVNVDMDDNRQVSPLEESSVPNSKDPQHPIKHEGQTKPLRKASIGSASSTTTASSKGAQSHQGFRGRPVIKATVTPRGGNSSVSKPTQVHAGDNSQIDAPTNFSNAHNIPNNINNKINSNIKVNNNRRTLSSSNKRTDLSRRAGTDVRLLVPDVLRGQAKAFTCSPRREKTSLTRNNTKLAAASPRARSDFGGLNRSPTRAHCRHCDACTIEYVRYWLQESNPGKKLSDMSISAESQEFDQSGHKDSRSLAAGAVDGQALTASQRPFYEPLQLLGQEGAEQTNQIYFLMKQASAAADYRMRREPINLHTVSAPKKGLIKLTGLPYELDNPEYYDDRKELMQQLEQQRHLEELYGSSLPMPSCDAHRGKLIRNRKILEQVRHGARQLQQEQEEEARKKLALNGQVSTVEDMLQYEIPEVPQLNTHMKQFAGYARGISPRLQHQQQQQHPMPAHAAIYSMNSSILCCPDRQSCTLAPPTSRSESQTNDEVSTESDKVQSPHNIQQGNMVLAHARPVEDTDRNNSVNQDIDVKTQDNDVTTEGNATLYKGVDDFHYTLSSSLQDRQQFFVMPELNLSPTSV